MANYYRYPLVFLLLLIAGFVNHLDAQNGNNPFELKHRLKNLPQEEGINAVTEDNEPQSISGNTDENPFELEHRLGKTPSVTPPPPVNTNPFEHKKPQTVRESEPGQSTTQTIGEAVAKPADSSFTFWTILCMLILFTLSFSMFKSYIEKVYRAFSNENFLKLVHREQAGFIQFPYFILYLIFIINLGIFIYLTARYFGAIHFDRFSLLISLIAIVGASFLLKHLVLHFLGFAFPISKEMKQYSFTITIFNIMIGIFLAPMNTFIAYAPENLTAKLIYSALIIMALTYLFRYFRGLFIGIRYMAMHKFHFFMYLCTVEIAPIFILLKIIMLTAEIQ